MRLSTAQYCPAGQVRLTPEHGAAKAAPGRRSVRSGSSARERRRFILLAEAGFQNGPAQIRGRDITGQHGLADEKGRRAGEIVIARDFNILLDRGDMLTRGETV